MKESYKVIEEFSLNAWPCLQELNYDGWILRFANGYTRRANSVSPLYLGSLTIAEKIKYCEHFYQAKQLRSVFKMSPFVYPPDLDSTLAQAGYYKDAETSVQTLDLSTSFFKSITAVQQWSEPADTWIKSYSSLNNVSAENKSTLKAILEHIVPQSAFVILLYQNQPVACALGVLEGSYVGLFDIVTAPTHRGQGFARQLIEYILQWAKKQGATTAYLQVMLDNPAALKLYTKLGFKEIYRYWYRMKYDNA